jgi:hypothetical protein
LKTAPTAIAPDVDSFPDEDDGKMSGPRKNAAASAGEIPAFSDIDFS